jgi:hypothetical protein
MKITEKEIAGIKKFCLTLTESQFLRFLEIIKDYSGDKLLWCNGNAKQNFKNFSRKK